MRAKRAASIPSVAIGLVLALAACGGGSPGQAAASPSTAGQAKPASGASASGTPKNGGTLTLAMSKDIQVTNPLVKTISTDQVVRRLMYEPLLSLDEHGDVEPLLAESWKVSDDGKIYTFSLRKGVKFHNGQEMTAADAKFAMDYTMDRKNGARGYDLLALVSGVQAVDKYTLQVNLKEVSSSFLPSLTSIQSFSVIPDGSLQPGVDKPAGFPPGTGPFSYVSWQPKQQLVMQRFADYWGSKAHVDKLVIRPIEDSSVAFTALRSGDVDVVERAPYEWVKEIKDGKLSGIGVTEARDAGYRRLVFNWADPPFNNPKLREAVAYGVNMKEILDAAYSGFGELADQKYPPDNTWYIPGVPSFSYDPAKAKAALAESGYNGQPIEMVVENASDVRTIAATIQSQLKNIGLNITIRSLEFASQRDLIQKGQFTFDMMGSNYHEDGYTTYAELLCESPRQRINNYAGYCNKDVDTELHDLQRELDTAKQKALLKQILIHEHDDLPQGMGIFVPRFYAFRDYVKDFVTDANQSLIWSGGGLDHAWLDK